jgi:putative oxidoreductase
MVDVDVVTWAPRARALLRIMAGLLFVSHGIAKLFGFPPGGWQGPVPEVGTLVWFAALIELVGSPFIIVGLFTRPVAFLLSGEMAVAYFSAHAPHSFFPILNHGEGAILYCFIFFYLFVAGAGAWSIDGVRALKPAPAPPPA